MKPAAFDYVRADSIEEVVAILAEADEAVRVLAGGQSLMAVLNMRLAAPRVLVDISRLESLRYCEARAGQLHIGAACTQSKVLTHAGLQREVPLLALALPQVAHVQIRNRGTTCGSIAHADPSAEQPLVLATLGGEVVLTSTAGERVIKAGEFFQGMLQTARRPDELIREVRFPLASARAGYGFHEFALRHGDFAIVAAAAVVSADSIRLGIGGVADRPVVQQWPRLAGADLDAEINDLAWSLEAQSDVHASAKLRRQLVRELGRRAIDDASRAINTEVVA
jgi:2-furoyl-CoA dehydrogenase FAD binding subunit